MAVSVLRRYTPPTCTLEIMAQNSPLSRWADRPVLKNVRFRLSLDGPHRSSDQHIRLQGDRPQLEALCTVVESYVQEMLTQSASQFSTGIFADLPMSSVSDSVAHHRHAPRSPEVGRSLVPPEVMLERHRSAQSSAQSPARVRSLQANVVPMNSPAAMQVQPKGRLKHEVIFGSLATEDSGPSATVSTIELFDLASALDQYRADNLTVPNLQRKGWLGAAPNWMKAAAVLVFAVGVGAPLMQVVEQQQRVSTASSDAAMENQSLATAERDDLTDIAPNSRRDAGLPNALRGRVENAPAQRGGQNRNRNANRADDNAASGQANQADSGATAGTSQESTTEAVPAQPRGLPPELAAIPPIREGETRREAPSVPASPSLEGDSSSDSADAGAIASAPSSASSSAPNSASRSSGWADDLAIADEAAPEAPQTATSTAPPSTIPQVNEIRDYFQGQWQPPAELDRSIEYRLLLNPNGSVQQIDPLGQTARTYAQQVGLPSIGAPFVSPLETNRPAQVRLILQPDGRVRTFLESWN